MIPLHICIDDAPHSQLRCRCIDSVRRHFGSGRTILTAEALAIGEDIRSLFAIKQPWDIASIRGRVTLSDWIRCWILSSDPGQYVYCDTDIEAISPNFPMLGKIKRPALLWRRDIDGSDYAVMTCPNAAAAEWLLDLLSQHSARPEILYCLMSRHDCPPIRGFVHHCSVTANERRWWAKK